MIWSTRAWGELDVIPLIAILSVSCIVMVPLLNWSSILHNAGQLLKEEVPQPEKLEGLLQQLERRETRRVSKLTQDEQHDGETFDTRQQRLKKQALRLAELDAASRTILLF